MKIHEGISLTKSCEGKFFLKGDLSTALILLGIVSKINDLNWFCLGDKSKHFHKVAGLTCSSLTIS